MPSVGLFVTYYGYKGILRYHTRIDHEPINMIRESKLEYMFLAWWQAMVYRTSMTIVPPHPEVRYPAQDRNVPHRLFLELPIDEDAVKYAFITFS